MTINLRKSISKVVKLLVLLIIIFSLSIINREDTKETSKLTSSQGLSNQKIEWGIKRNDNHEQPDLGTKNKQLLEKSNGIAIGNKEDKYVYLTFDEGYEAGYTSQILKTLKENNVTAAFFLTAHYLNTQPDLVNQMIDEGHIVRKSYSKS